MRPRRSPARRARSATSWSVGTPNRPSNAALPGRTSGSRSRARRVRSSSSVKSSVNQPVSATPSISFVVCRSANSWMDGDVGRADLVLVPRDQDAVLRGHHVGLDEIGALLDRQLVARERVLRPVARRAAVGDDDPDAAATAAVAVVNQVVPHPSPARCSSVSRSGRKIARRPIPYRTAARTTRSINEGAKRARQREAAGNSRSRRATASWIRQRAAPAWSRAAGHHHGRGKREADHGGEPQRHADDREVSRRRRS